MRGIFTYFKSVLSGPPSRVPATQTQAGQDSRDEERVLDPSAGPMIRIPSQFRATQKYEQRPPEYWALYNAVESHYKRGWYERAKTELLELEKLGTLHPTARTLRLRTYRKLITKEKTKKVVSEKAIALCEEMFVECADEVTNTDRRAYNQLLDRLPPSSSSAQKARLSIVSRSRVPEYEVVEQSKLRVCNVVTCEASAKDIRGRGNWHFAELVPSGVVYGKRGGYDEQLSRYTQTSFVHSPFNQYQPTNWIVDANVRLLAAAEKANIVATISGSLELSTWTPTGQLLASRSLRDLTTEFYELRSLAVSPEGEYIVVAAADRVQLLDSGLSVKNRWRTPLKEGWVKQTVAATEDPRRVQIQEDMATLNLTRTVTPSELRKAFHQLILKHHPDRNPNNPEATDKTVTLLQAYERLSGVDDIEHALDGLDHSDYYYNLISQFKVEVPGLGLEFTIGMSLGGDGRDWVYASYLTERAERIYLGAYSGKVYCISKCGIVLRTFDTGETMQTVRESLGHIWMQSFAAVHIFQGERLIRHLPLATGSHVSWGSAGFCIFHGKEVTLFTSPGEVAARLLFSRPVSIALWPGESLLIETSDRRFVFSTEALA